MTKRINFLLEEELTDESLKGTFSALAIASMLAFPKIVHSADLIPIVSSGSMPQIQQELRQIGADQKDNSGYSKLQAANIVARTLFREAQGEGEEGIRAVASAIWNRAKQNKDNLTSVIFKPKQFSCWNKMTPEEKDPEKFQIKIPSDAQNDLKTWELCKKIAEEMLSGTFTSTIGTRDHYYAKTMSVPPSWDASMTFKKTIGNHIFGLVDAKMPMTTIKVSSGDSLSKIAKKIQSTTKNSLVKEMSLQELVNYISNQNGLKNPNNIKVGQTLKVPN